VKTLTANALSMAIALAASSMACSQSPSPHPAGIGDCQGSATSCGVGITVGSSTGGGTDGGSADGSAGDGATGLACGTISSRDPNCEACLEHTCCQSAIVCSNTDECIALQNCLQFCTPGDVPCVSGCQNLHTTGLPTYNIYVQCLQTNCAVPCQLADAGANCGTLVLSGACDVCVNQSCCSQAANCSNDPDCLTLGSCLQTCASNDTTCVANCQALAPNGTGIYSSLGTCIQNSCAAPCQ
jgi:hypothetical protein